MHRFLLLAALVSLVASQALAQDAVTVDPKHYKVEFENDQVRVLRIHYGPHEKSVMHDHPAGVGVRLTDEYMKFIYPGGKTEEEHQKAGTTGWGDAVRHLPENLSDKPFELIFVELKGGVSPSKPAATKPVAKKPGA